MRAAVLALALALGASASPLHAQFLWRPDAEWRTIETEHFVVHYPREFEEWTRAMAERLEGVRAAVGREVGSVPRERVAVLVTDPMNESNGSALPFIEAPAIIVWPTPPDPRSGIGNARSWGEILAVHEFAHLAHLTRPTRNPREALLMRLSPLGFGPVLRKSPRWVIEGYATYVEGRLTGTGRPHGVWRPAMLRQWALEGRLPTYGQLSGWDEFRGGNFAYLGGSAFLEWLAARRGDSTIVHLWRRMSARRNRSFDAAFTGVYGDVPRSLYGRFTAELTGQALEIERELKAAGLIEGTLVQRLAWGTGDPAVSPDGKRIAVVLRGRETPPRVVVWNTADEPEDSARIRARERARRRDPEDVPDVPFYPRPKRTVATLRAENGFGYDAPRWMPGGEQLLATRAVPLSDGTLRYDLFEWNTKTKHVRRITHGAGIRAADPYPDGRSAAALRCARGSCDLVRVSLADGAVTVLAAGSPLRAFYRPRVAPDGRTVVATVSDSGQWRLAAVDDAGFRFLDARDGVNRFDPEFVADGRLLYVSEAGGVPNVAVRSLVADSARQLTRVTGVAIAPSVGGGRDVYFLSLHAQGLDVRRILLDGARLEPVAIEPGLAPAAQRPVVAADTFPRSTLGAPRSYGLGPREYRFLAGYGIAADGKEGTIAVASTDKVGRLTWIAQGSIGSEWRPRGGSVAAAWRGFRPAIELEAMALSRDASRQLPAGFTSALDDIDLRGGDVATSLDVTWAGGYFRGEIGGALQRMGVAGGGQSMRTMGFANTTGYFLQRGERRLLSERLQLHVASGRGGGGSTGDWMRGVAGLDIVAGTPQQNLELSVQYGAVTRETAFGEQFVVGGAPPSFTTGRTLEQWVAMPVLPFGAMRGDRVYSYRAAIGGGGFEPYFWWGSAGRSFDDWMRVAGIDATVAVPPLPILRMPAARAQAGVGYSLDDPWKKKVRAYLSVAYRP
ncbi:MAG TPA: hypothetical protein VHM67_02325 [Gemmatimonadaceae bacterium]|nr:hypothetical protein [Gemmatimonadaceae bacterium]